MSAALKLAEEAAKTRKTKDIERAADATSEALVGAIDAADILSDVTGYARLQTALAAARKEVNTIEFALADIAAGEVGL